MIFFYLFLNASNCDFSFKYFYYYYNYYYTLSFIDIIVSDKVVPFPCTYCLIRNFYFYFVYPEFPIFLCANLPIILLLFIFIFFYFWNNYILYNCSVNL